MKISASQVERSVPILTASLIRTYAILVGILCCPFEVVVFTLAAIVLERLCATIFLDDYERKKRRGLGAGLLLGVTALSALTSYLLTFRALSKRAMAFIDFGKMVLPGIILGVIASGFAIGVRKL